MASLMMLIVGVVMCGVTSGGFSDWSIAAATAANGIVAGERVSDATAVPLITGADESENELKNEEEVKEDEEVKEMKNEKMKEVKGVKNELKNEEEVKEDEEVKEMRNEKMKEVKGVKNERRYGTLHDDEDDGDERSRLHNHSNPVYDDTA
ncbi:unnamed protein product [Lampetra fluviatilis]